MMLRISFMTAFHEQAFYALRILKFSRLGARPAGGFCKHFLSVEASVHASKRYPTAKVRLSLVSACASSPSISGVGGYSLIGLNLLRTREGVEAFILVARDPFFHAQQPFNKAL